MPDLDKELGTTQSCSSDNSDSKSPNYIPEMEDNPTPGLPLSRFACGGCGRVFDRASWLEMHCKGKNRVSACSLWYYDIYLPLAEHGIQAAFREQANRLEAESTAQDHVQSLNPSSKFRLLPH